MYMHERANIRGQYHILRFYFGLYIQNLTFKLIHWADTCCVASFAYYVMASEEEKKKTKTKEANGKDFERISCSEMYTYIFWSSGVTLLQFDFVRYVIYTMHWMNSVGWNNARRPKWTEMNWSQKQNEKKKKKETKVVYILAKKIRTKFCVGPLFWHHVCVNVISSLVCSRCALSKMVLSNKRFWISI